MIYKLNLFLICFIVVFLLLINTSLARTNISLAWSAENSYTPLSYIGRPLPVLGSLITVTAVLDQNLANQNLFFYWYLDDKLAEKASGFQKQSFGFIANKSSGQKNIVSLAITNKDKSQIAYSKIEIPIVLPQVVFYKNTDPILIALKEEIIIEPNSDLTVLAQPYYFNIENLDDLNFNWSAGEKSAVSKTSEKNPNMLNIKTKQTKQGFLSRLYLTISNKKNSNQYASAYVNLLSKKNDQ